MAKKFHDGYYTGVDNRRALEKADSSIMPSGDNEFACVPQEIVHKIWPSNDQAYMSHSNLDDTITGVDSQRAHNKSQIGKGFKPTK